MLKLLNFTEINKFANFQFFKFNINYLTESTLLRKCQKFNLPELDLSRTKSLPPTLYASCVALKKLSTSMKTDLNLRC